MTTDLILGTAGHIDHGKTSLIRALTGIETDRLPEEKKRGITIELGFAHLDLPPYRLGIVDVPGHERFVRNMLAGATGMDLALLVVAADDSIKQQTLEHLEILRLLKLPAGVIAITKCDVAQSDWLNLVEEEIRGLVADTFLAQAPIVRTSSHTGAGIDELKDKLKTAAEIANQSDRLLMIDAPFRMAIDRTFAIEGHGTVVTGSVSSGRAKIGDELSIEPGGISVRIRGLQNHDQAVEAIHRGQRAAINLAGVHHDQTERGQELTTRGYLLPSKLLTVNLMLLEHIKRPLKNRMRARLHIGTAELMCTVRLIGRESLEPGESCPAQLYLSQPAVAIWNQPFVLRSESPVTTIGGGQVLDPNAGRIRFIDEMTLKHLAGLSAPDGLERASAAAFFAGLQELTPADFVRHAGVKDAESIAQRLVDRGDLVEFQLSHARKQFVHQDVLNVLSERFADALKTLHLQHPLRSVFAKSSFLSGFQYLGDQSLLEAILKYTQQQKVIRVTPRGISLEGYGPSLSQNEQKLMLQILDWYLQAGLETPTVKACVQQATKNRESVPQLVQIAVNDGELIEISSDYLLHSDVEKKIRDQIAQSTIMQEGATMSQLRDLLGTTRKYAIPLFEYFDRVGFTLRDGDLRKLGTPQAATDQNSLPAK
jgi:selenocysteine-specific elongation factor